MSDNFDLNAPLSIEAQLTAWVLGELTGDEADAIACKVEADADLQAQVRALRETLGLLSMSQPEPTLSNARLAALRAEVGGKTKPRPRLLRFPVLGSIAAAVLFGVFVLPQLTMQADMAPGVESEATMEARLSRPEVASQSDSARMQSQPMISAGLPVVPAAAPSSPTSPSATVGVGGGSGGKFTARGGKTQKPTGKYGGRMGNGGQPRRRNTPALSSLVELGYAGVRLEALEERKLLSEATEDFDFDSDLRLKDLGHATLEERFRLTCNRYRRIPGENPRQMFFRFYGDHAFVDTRQDSLSTFAADVDTASYALMRNYLQKGHLPKKEAVRTEECVNYFDAGLTAPIEGDFAIHLEAFDSPFGDGGEHTMVRVGIRARDVSQADRKPLNLVFVVDRSGSMNSGNRMEMVQRSLGLLIDQIREGDTLALVSFNNSARVDLEPTTSAERWKIRDAVKALQTGGSTNVADGMMLGYEMAERAFRPDAVNRVILCSDGVANTGETDQKRILEWVAKSAEQQIDLLTVGVGMGNHNDVLLEQLADKGNGACHYVDTYDEAKRIFVEGFVGNLQTIARDVKIQVEFDGEVISSWRQLGYENRAVADKDFRNDAVDAGEIGAGHSITALYELQMRSAASETVPLATVRLRWKPDGGSKVIEMEQQLSLAARGSFAAAAPRARLAVAVAQFAEVMRRSQHAKGDSYAKLEQMAETLGVELKADTAVKGFAGLVQTTRALVEKLPADDELAQMVDEGRRLRLLEAALLQQEKQSEQVVSLLAELTKQNEALEKRIREYLED